MVSHRINKQIQYGRLFLSLPLSLSSMKILKTMGGTCEGATFSCTLERAPSCIGPKGHKLQLDQEIDTAVVDPCTQAIFLAVHRLFF